jgi:sigma-E factor negative regulatory protein RseB
MAHMQGAPCKRAYVGTFVVISAKGAMSSSRIAQACEGGMQVERVESLTGLPRTVYRRNGEVRTFYPQTRTVRTDRSDSLGLFPQPPAVQGAQLSRFYAVQKLGSDRVAGRSADVLWFKPLDDLRWGYRIWSDQETGLIMKLQTLVSDASVIEQAAFSEIDWNASISAGALSRAMEEVDGFQAVSFDVQKTTAQREGWALRQPVDGFVPVQCYRRAMLGNESDRSVVQCLYSDGMASVSLFLEPWDASRHAGLQAQEISMGATQLLGRKVGADTWLTVVGEVPRKTLYRFSQHWERLR